MVGYYRHEWYQPSHLTFIKKTNQRSSQNVEVLCWTIFFLYAQMKQILCIMNYFFFTLPEVVIESKFHIVFRPQIIFRENCFYWGWITIQASQSAAPGPLGIWGPALPKFTMYHLLFSNLIKCKFVWEYALFSHSIDWTDRGLSQIPALLSSLASLLCRDSGPFHTTVGIFLPWVCRTIFTIIGK